MRQVSLDAIAPLLAVLRAHAAVDEVRPLTFHLQGRDFVHFHDDPGGVEADVRLPSGVLRMRVASDPVGLLGHIEECLAKLDSRGRDRERRGRRAPRG
jgi:hypothetical protein